MDKITDKQIAARFRKLMKIMMRQMKLAKERNLYIEIEVNRPNGWSKLVEDWDLTGRVKINKKFED